MEDNPILQDDTKRDYASVARKSPTNTYYIYAHRKLSDNSIFYIGKGKGYRAWYTTGRNDYWFRVARKYGCYVDIIFDNLEEQEAYELENCTIQEMLYFNEKLTNLSEGGEGGFNPSLETRMKMSLGRKGKKPHNLGKPLPSVSMEKNGCADHTTYTFIHLNGDIFTGTRYELVRKFELKLDMIGKLFYSKKNRRNRIYGWSLLNE